MYPLVHKVGRDGWEPMCYHVGHLDVEQSVGAQVLEDVGQSSGVVLVPPQGADPSAVVLVHHALEDLHPQSSQPAAHRCSATITSSK